MIRSPFSVCALVFGVCSVHSHQKITNTDMPTPDDDKKYYKYEDLDAPLGEDETFLNNIRQIESSGGKDTNHKTMEEGIHKGTAALGDYGLMPNTIREIARRVKSRDNKLSLDPEFSGDPDVERYSNPDIPDEEVSSAYAKDPRLQLRTARYLRELLRTRHGDDREKMAFGWNMGHNTPTDRIASEDLETNPYVTKFRNLRGIMKK